MMTGFSAFDPKRPGTKAPIRFGEMVLLSVAVALALPVAGASAQDLTVSLGAGWYNPGGDDFKETDSGPGLDAVLRLKAGRRLQVGVGAQWNRHDVGFSDDDWDVVGVFFEPSVAIASRGRVESFLAGRVGWLHQAIDAPSGNRRGTGFGFGGFVGVRVSLRAGMELEGAVPIYRLSFGDVDVDGVERSGSDSSGRAVGIRVAVNVRL